MEYLPVHVEKSQHKRLKLLGAQMNLSIKELVRQSIESYIPPLEENMREEIVQRERQRQAEEEKRRQDEQKEKERIAEVVDTHFGKYKGWRPKGHEQGAAEE